MVDPLPCLQILYKFHEPPYFPPREAGNAPDKYADPLSFYVMCWYMQPKS